MKVFNLLEKLKKVNKNNLVWLKDNSKKCKLSFNVDDAGDINMYVVDQSDGELLVKDLVKFLRQVDSCKEVFLSGIKGISYYFTGLKYDSNANILLSIKKRDLPA